MSNTYDNIYKLLNNFDCNTTSYFKKYGFHILITVIYLILIIYTIVYLNIKLNIKNIRKNWSKYRCNPAYIPFAGFINKPSNMSSFEYTKMNFDFCSIKILNNIASEATMPITYLQNLIFLILKSISESLNLMRDMFNKIRDSVTNITKIIMSRIMNIVIPFITMIINVKDTISKINGVFTASIYTLYSLVLSLVASIRLIQQFLVTAMFALVAGIILAIGLGWLFPPMFALIIPGIALATILTVVIASMSSTLLGSFNISSNPSVPNIPTFCFDKNTILTMKDNTKKYIKDIKLGDILHDGSIVEAFMVSNSKNNIMYKLNNIIVSSKHKIFSKKLGWINVEDHPLSIKIDNYNEPFIYCLSTNSKIINIDNIT